MPEFDNDSDRLEQFFRKATTKPEVPFSEDDWKKLEARLDAADAAQAVKVESPNKTIITAVVVGALLLSSLGIWWGSAIDQSATNENQANVSSPVTARSQPETLEGNNEVSGARDDHQSSVQHSASTIEKATSPLDKDAPPSVTQQPISSAEERIPPPADERHSTPDEDVFSRGKRGGAQPGPFAGAVENEVVDGEDSNALNQDNSIGNDVRQLKKDQPVVNKDVQPIIRSDEQTRSAMLVPLADGKVQKELVVAKSDFAERNKQRARIELPGAEEADQTGRQTMVEEEHASEKEHVAKPRLSLLLSFAPDFSGTSLNQYSPPGKAFGGMIHYHLKNRWSISAGVVKNYKQYTGAGEDYSPPKGYWKYYTNGIIPETIDGSCSILEFPIMVQYTVRNGNKNRWIVGAGASSYVMQTESYRYYFAQPNPGAKEGWDSRASSRFMFNMLNLTVGYEHQVIPGLMIGLEPYVKLPLEEIGWSNLRLYSSGASLTLRYTLVGRRQIIPVASRSRGPD